MPTPLRPLPPPPTLVLRPGVVLDLGHREVRHAGGVTPLTTLEARLLARLGATPGETVSRERLLKDVWGFRRAVATHAVENAVMRARQKIEVDPSQPRHLLTVQSEGYRLEIGATFTPAAPAAASVHSDDRLPRADVVGQVLAALSTARVVTVVGPPGAGKSTVAAWVMAAPGPGASDVRLFDDATSADDAAAWVAQGGRALVTAWGRLGLAGEKVIPLPPVAAEPARAWLGEAFAGGGPRTGEEEVALGELVDACGGSPLTLALVAEHAPTLPPSALLRRVRGSPLALRRRGGPARHSSWAAALAGPWAALSPEGRELAASAAPFVGPAPLEALRCGGDPFDAATDLAALSLATMCVDSLQRPCLRLFEPLAAFAREPDRMARSSAAYERATLSASGDGGGRDGAPRRPGADDNGASDAEKRRAETGAHARIGEPGADERHAEWALRSPGPRGAASPSVGLRELEAAWRRFHPRADTLALRLAVALADRLRSGVDPALHEEVLARATEGGPDDLVAEAWLLRAEQHRVAGRLGPARAALDTAAPVAAHGRLAGALAFQEAVLEWRRSPSADALAALRAARELAERHGDRLHAARAAYFLGAILAERGVLSESTPWFERAREGFAAEGRIGEEARALNDAAIAHRLLGELDSAHVYLQRALAAAARAEDLRMEAVVRTNLGSLAAARGEWAHARVAYRDAAAVHRQTGSRVGEGTALNNLADLELEWGNVEEAALAALAAVLVFAEGDAPIQRGVALSTLGDVRTFEGRFEDAVSNLRAAVRLHEDAQVLPRTARTRLELGVALHRAGRLDEAAEALDRAIGELDQVGDPARRLRARVHRLGVAVARGEEPPPSVRAAALPRIEEPADGAWQALAEAWLGEGSFDAAAARVAACEGDAGAGRAPVAGAWWLRLALLTVGPDETSRGR